MPHIPTAICLTCQMEMTPDRNGALIKAQRRDDADGTPHDYYIVSGDRYRCPVCDATIITGFANRPMAEHFESEKWSQLEPFIDHSFRFRGDRPKVHDSLEALKIWQKQIEKAIRAVTSRKRILEGISHHIENAIAEKVSTL